MKTATAPSSAFAEGLRPSERERAALVETVESAQGAERRRHPRIMLEGRFSVLLTVNYVGGSIGRFRIYPWDLSRGGLGFFHRSFVHPGTRCTIHGQAASGKPVTMDGQVARCSHVAGTVHTVGIKFDTDIDPEIFLGEAARADNGSAETEGAIDAPQAANTPKHQQPIPTSTTDDDTGATGDQWWDRMNALCAELNSLVNTQAEQPTLVHKLRELLEAAEKPRE